MRGSIALLATAAVVAGCSTAWFKSEDVSRVSMVKIETEHAPLICSSLLGSRKRGCAVRVRDTATDIVRCVVIVLPDDSDAVAHEGGHCMGYDHK